VLARGEVRDVTGDAAWLGALLRVEVTLAQVQADLGLIPVPAAAAIVSAARPERFDIAALGADAAASGNPVVPLVAALRAALPADIAPYVHKGATSQDIVDSAAMLVTRDALEVILADARSAADAAAGLAHTYRDAPMMARTLLRQALPMTFGLKAAGWMVGLDEAGARLSAVRATRLAVQFGGPAGTLSDLDGAGLAVVGGLARELGLAVPVLPWHTDRTRIAEIAGALGELAGVCAKVARDVTLLAQDEVGEVEEDAPGGSSSMAHKRNAVAAVSAIGSAMRAPGLVATLLAAMAHEHERAAGAWHAEWLPLRDLLVSTGSAVAWLRTCLAGLRVDPARMLSQVDGKADVGASGALIDHALAQHEAPR
jgi:3-carboxy-cis,cis-muconate cycloisomerase